MHMSPGVRWPRSELVQTLPVAAGGGAGAPISLRSRADLPAQALEHGAPALLWRCALDGVAGPEAGGAGARDELAHAVATALGDLLAYRGGDAVFVAAQHVALGGQCAAWYSATVHASRPLRVAAAAHYCLHYCMFSAGACLGVRALPPLSPMPLERQLPRHTHITRLP